MQQPVEIFEVGPRDGLQNEPAFISSADKIALTEALARRPDADRMRQFREP